MRDLLRWGVMVVAVVWAAGAGARAQGGVAVLAGVVRDGNGAAVAGARVRVGAVSTVADAAGQYTLRVPVGRWQVEVSRAVGGAVTGVEVQVEGDQTLDLVVGREDSVTVRAEEDVLEPDPSAQGYGRGELLPANPGRPGVPVSVPGYPVETASGGIKAPQYFAPGVAGDHGEPVAQFFAVGDFLLQNNLTANAHGNGYADPNFVVGETMGGVLVDNAGYNARYGDHAVNLQVTFGVRETLPRFVRLTTDGRDGAAAMGWSPKDGRVRAWVAGEGMWGNGFLHRAEERQQYKLNGLRTWTPGRHEVSAWGVGYYGFSRIPGLIPIGVPVKDDTVDYRQLDLTHTAIGLVTDRWQLGEGRTLTYGGFFRTYSLKLRSNFGDGLIQQSEFRTVTGGTATYTQAVGRQWQVLGGAELRREAPRGLDLQHADAAGVLQPVTSNDLTIGTVAGFGAVSGRPLQWLGVYAGLRRDALHFDNRDRIEAANSFSRWAGVWGPKATVTVGTARGWTPEVAGSYGWAFHANDPRIGTGAPGGTPASLLIRAREWQVVAREVVAGTEVRLTVAKVTSSAELAKIDADTGLQEDVGPSRNRFLTVQARRRFGGGWVQASWSAADARDRGDGTPIPEAPRTIVDAVGGWDRLPLGLRVQGEFEYVKAKPLGDGFTGVPVRETRVGLGRSFADGRWTVEAQGLLGNGYTGQTLETLALPGEGPAFERAVGVPLRSYGVVTVRRQLGR